MRYHRAIAIGAGLILLATALLATSCGEPATPTADPIQGAPVTQPAPQASGNVEQPAEDALPELRPEATLGLDDLPDLPELQTQSHDRELPENAQALLAEARQLRQDGDIPGAIAKIERVVGYDPNNPDVQELLGLTYMQLPDYGKAEEHLRQAEAYKGNDVELQFTLGRLALQQKDVNQAVTHFRRARQADNADPANPTTALNTLLLGQLLERQGYFTAALESYNQLNGWLAKYGSNYRDQDTLRELALNPEKLLVMRGRLLILLQDKQAAAELFQRAWAHNRSDTQTAQYLLGLLIDLDRFEPAQDLLVELSAAEGVQAALPVLAERLCEKVGDPALPAKLWDAMRAKAGTDTPPADVGLRLANVAAKLGSNDAARQILQAVIDEAPSNADAAEQLAALFAETGNHIQALQLLGETIARNNNAIAAVRTGVQEILRRNPPETLLQDFSKQTYAAEGDNKYALHYVAGVLAEETGNPLKAADHYRRAAAERKDFLPVYEALLELSLEAKDNEEIDVLLGMVRDVAEDNHLYNYLLGRSMLARGETDNAIEALEKAYEQNSSHLQTLLALADAYEVKLDAAMDSGDRAGAYRAREKVESFLQQAISLRPDDMSVYRRLFDLYIARGDTDSAKTLAEQLFRSHPRTYEALAMLAEAYMHAGEHDKAAIVFKRIQRDHADEPGAGLLILKGEIARHSANLPREIYASASASDYFHVQTVREVIPAAVQDRIVAQLQSLLTETPDDTDARELLAQRLGYRVPGNYARAAEQFETLYKQTQEPDIARRAAYFYMLGNEPAKGLAVLEPLPGTDTDTLRLKALLLRDAAQYDQAVDILKGMLAQDKQNAAVLLALVETYDQAGKHEDAAKLLAEPTDALPDGQRLISRAIQLCKAGKTDDALALPGGDDNIGLVWECYDTLLAANNYQAAATFADKLIELTRTLPEAERRADLLPIAVLLRMQVAVQADDLDKAKQLAKDFSEDLTGEDDAYVRLAYALIREQLFEKAGDILTARLAELETIESPNATQKEALRAVRGALVDNDMRAGRQKQALEAIDALLADNPNKASLHNLRATVLGELDRGEEASKAIARAIELTPTRQNDKGELASYQNNLAYNYAELGSKLDQAEGLAIQALNNGGWNIGTVDTLAWVYYKQARLSEAAALLLSQLPELNELDDLDAGTRRDDHAIIWDHLGDTLYRLGYKDLAARVWQVALDRTDGEPETRDIRLVRQMAPRKIEAVRNNQAAPIAPLSQAHEDRIEKATQSDTDTHP